MNHIVVFITPDITKLPVTPVAITESVVAVLEKPTYE
jgi:hypothetical protein